MKEQEIVEIIDPPFRKFLVSSLNELNIHKASFLIVCSLFINRFLDFHCRLGHQYSEWIEVVNL